MPTPDFQAPSLDSLNATLPEYDFHDVLASNEHGAVYYATQKSLDREVAIKVFSPALSSDSGFRRIYANCTATVAGLRHANLIGIYNSGAVDGMYYLTMEYVPGKSMARSMRGGSIELKQSMAILKQLCEGVAYAHKKDLVHGNLSPYDILLNQQAVPKIGNFGLGSEVHTLTDTEVPTHFIAPEVLDGGAPTEASDIYSLAAIFYELVSGTPYRFGGPKLSDLEQVPKALDEVMGKALVKDPDSRSKDALEFHEALRQAAKPKKSAPANGSPAKAPAEKAAQSGKPGRQKARVSPLVRVIIILVLLICIHQVWQHRKNEKARRAAGGEPADEPVTVTQVVQHVPVQPNPQPQPATPPAPAQPTESFAFPEVEELPMDSLERLRGALAQGQRDEMPIGTITKGDSHYFFVDKPMTWQEAQHFAAGLGGHLVLPDGDMSWRGSKPVQGQGTWLGVARGGSTAFTTLEGRVWAAPAGLNGNGHFIWLDGEGYIRSAAADSTKTFVIQWRQDGSNSATLHAQLTATAASLKSGSPVYPPTTVVMGARHYLAVAQQATWHEARAHAEAAGGHLAVISDEGELNELQKVAAGCASSGEFWVGGYMEGDLWAWTSGEPWRAVAWLDETAAGQDGAAMLLKAGLGVDAKEKSQALAGFIIEWSKDAQSNQQATPAGPVIGDAIEELRTKAKGLVAKAGEDKEAAHKKNTDKLAWDLDSHMRGMNKSTLQQWKPDIDALKKCVQNNRLHKATIDGSGARLSPFMAKLCNYIIDKQAKIDEGHVASLRSLHASYLNKLASIRDQAKLAGQIKSQLKASELIEDSQDFDAWLRSMGG